MAKFSQHDIDEESRLEKEYEKRGIFAYFDIVFNKFVALMNVNFFYLLFSLPYILFLFWLSPINAGSLAKMSTVAAQILGDFTAKEAMMTDLVLRFIFVMGIIVLWGSGPASAGIAYILRNYSRREHAWVWADFIYAIRQNFGQSILVMVIDILVMFLSATALNFYSQMFSGTILTYIYVAFAFILCLYTFMHFYVYQFMVTYKDSIRQIYRNSFVFAIIKWLPNLLLLAGNAGVILALFYFMQLFALVPFVIMLTILMALTIHFYSARSIARYVEKLKK